MVEATISEEAAEAMTDNELVDAVEHNVWLAAFSRVHCKHDENCSVLYREANA